MHSHSMFATVDGGGQIVLPINLKPRMSDDLINERIKVNVQFLPMGAEGAPWAGYYATFNDAKLAVENYQGVWFDLIL